MQSKICAYDKTLFISDYEKCSHNPQDGFFYNGYLIVKEGRLVEISSIGYFILYIKSWFFKESATLLHRELRGLHVMQILGYAVSQKWLTSEQIIRIRVVAARAGLNLNDEPVKQYFDMIQNNTSLLESELNRGLDVYFKHHFLELKKFDDAILGRSHLRKLEGVRLLLPLQEVDIPAPAIKYVKGQIRTKTLIETQKDAIGTGCGCEKVCISKMNSSEVVKKQLEGLPWGSGLQKEYEMGATLKHRNIVKAHSLYIKSYMDGKKKYKLVMEKVEGTTFNKYSICADLISCKTAMRLILQAKDCCNYLFSQNVVWGDLRADNIFLTTSENLKIVDLGCWRKEGDPKKRAKGLLVGAMQIVNNILHVSMMNSQSDGFGGSMSNLDRVRSTSFPDKFFDGYVDFASIISIIPDYYDQEDWMMKVDAQLTIKTESEMVDYIDSYFDEVIALMGNDGSDELSDYKENKFPV